VAEHYNTHRPATEKARSLTDVERRARRTVTSTRQSEALSGFWVGRLTQLVGPTLMLSHIYTRTASLIIFISSTNVG